MSGDVVAELVFEDAGAGRLVRIENRFGKALTLSWTSTTATVTDFASPNPAIAAPQTITAAMTALPFERLSHVENWRKSRR